MRGEFLQARVAIHLQRVELAVVRAAVRDPRLHLHIGLDFDFA